MNQVIDAIKGRRSIRRYNKEEIPRDTVKELLDAGAMSPSAMNSQPWRFIVIEDRLLINELSEHVKKQLSSRGYAKRFSEKINTNEDLIFYSAPLLVLIAVDPDDKWCDINTGIASQSMMLAAHSLGLGSCYIGLANTLNEDPAMLEQAGVPEGFEIKAALVFGYPEESKTIPKREPKVVKWIGRY